MLAPDLEIRILDLALSRGLLNRDELAGLAEPSASAPVRWGLKLDRLLESGALSQDLLDALAWEAIHVPPASEEDSSVPVCPDSWVSSARDNFSQEQDILPDTLHWNRYRDLTFLGIGGAARVYRAFDPVLQREVALKFLRGVRTQQRELLLKEARAQAKVDHPNVCKVFEVGDSNGFSYISMKLVHGQALANAMGSLDLRTKVAILRDVAEGAHAAHRMGLVHLDLKPGNILLEAHEGGGLHPYVTDFGLVAEAGSADEDISKPASMGTPPFSSPEQVRGIPQADRRADVYSLGATLYVALSGKMPFAATSFQSLLEKITTQPPIPLTQVMPDLPSDLVAIIEKCMAKDREKRYSTALALSEDLQRFLDGEPILAREQTWMYRGRTWFRRNRKLGILAGVSVVLVGALGIMSLSTSVKARARARLAQRFGQEVEATEALVRFAHLQELHDIQPELQVIDEHLRSLDVEVARSGALGAGPGNHALGRGYLAIGQPEKARAFLEQAIAAGEQSPDLELDLGRALGALYRQELTGLAAIRNPEKRKQQNRTLIRDLRDPALAHLYKGKGASQSSEAYLRGLIALYEERYAEARFQARAAQQLAPWFYEAHLLEGQVAMAQERSGLVYSGKSSEAGQASLDETARCFEEAAYKGPSDPEVYRCQAELQYRRILWDEDLHPDHLFASIQQGLEVLDRGLRAQPSHGELHRFKASFLWIKGEYEDRRGLDASGSFQEARAEADRAVTFAPGDPRMHKERANVLGATALWLENHGRSTLEPLAEALKSLQKAVELGTREREADNTLAWLLDLQARELMDAGQDPRPSFRRSIQVYSQVLQTQPKDMMALCNLGLAYAQVYELDLEEGHEEESMAERGSEALSKAQALFPRFSAPLGNGAYLCRLRSRAAREEGRDSGPWIAQALRLGQQACELSPAKSTPRMELAAAEIEAARCMAATQQIAERHLSAAALLLGDGKKLNPNDPDIPAVEADLWLMRGRSTAAGAQAAQALKKGLEAADRALKINARNQEARALRGSLLLELGQKEKGAQRRKDLAQAALDLDAAIHGNPFLRRRYGPGLAEARKG